MVDYSVVLWVMPVIEASFDVESLNLLDLKGLYTIYFLAMSI